MREQANNHSDPIPNAENWILVSDPFERPKIYRHKHAIFMADDKCGVYIFVIRAADQAPIILHDIMDFEMSHRVKAGSLFSLYAAPVLRLIIDDTPLALARAYPIMSAASETYLYVPDYFIRNSSISGAITIKTLASLTFAEQGTPFRLKVEGQANPEYQYGNPRTFRGTLSAEATLAIKQAIVLYEHFKRAP